MKILNAGTANFIVRDKRGNSVCLEPTKTVEVADNIGRKVARVYSYIKIVEEKPIEKVEEKKVEEIIEKPKKAKRKKNVSTTD